MAHHPILPSGESQGPREKGKPYHLLWDANSSCLGRRMKVPKLEHKHVSLGKMLCGPGGENISLSLCSGSISIVVKA